MTGPTNGYHDPELGMGARILEHGSMKTSFSKSTEQDKDPSENVTFKVVSLGKKVDHMGMAQQTKGRRSGGPIPFKNQGSTVRREKKSQRTAKLPKNFSGCVQS